MPTLCLEALESREAPSLLIDAPISEYVASGSWGRTSLTYSVHAPSLSQIGPIDQVRAAITQSLQLWANVVPLHFTEVPDTGPEPNITTDYSPVGVADIRFSAVDMSQYPGALAGAYIPGTANGLAGDVFMRKHITWSNHPAYGYDMNEVFPHEIGHALGLGHEEFIDALMNPNYKGIFNGPGTAFLKPDDIAGIQSIYGEGDGDVGNGDNPNNPEAPTRREGLTELSKAIEARESRHGNSLSAPSILVCS